MSTLLTRLRCPCLNAIILLLLSAAFFFTSFSLSRWHNDFPIDYQPDEVSKSGQLIDDTRNFHHPLLMLNVADVLATWQHTPRDPTPMIRVGRDASAAMAGGAAVMLAWAGLVAEGWAGCILVGLAASLCPAVISHAHYFKEEAALTLGVGAVVFAGAVLCRVRHPAALQSAAALLGAACGLAASGKYPGAIFLVPSIVLTIAACGRRWIISPLAVLLLIAVAAAAWSGINSRAVQHWAEFRDGFSYEETHATTDHLGVTMDRPNGFFVSEVMGEAMPHVAVLAVLAPIVLLLQRRRTMIGFWIIGLGGVYLLMLSYSVIPFYRYVLPVTLLLHVLAAFTVTWLARLAIGWPMWRGAILGAGVAIIGGAQLERCLDYDEQFAHDSRLALQQWLADAVPPGALIAADDYVRLSDILPGHLPPFDAECASDYGTITSLKRRGFAYVITVGNRCDRYLNAYVHPAAGEERRFTRRMEFYKTLARDCPIVWQTRAVHPMETFSNPDLTVYRLFTLRPKQ